MISLSHLMLIMFIEVETLISNSNYTRGIIGEGGSSTLYQSLEDFKHAQNSPAFVPLDINGMTWLKSSVETTMTPNPPSETDSFLYLLKFYQHHLEYYHASYCIHQKQSIDSVFCHPRNLVNVAHCMFILLTVKWTFEHITSSSTIGSNVETIPDYTTARVILHFLLENLWNK